MLHYRSSTNTSTFSNLAPDFEDHYSVRSLAILTINILVTWPRWVSWIQIVETPTLAKIHMGIHNKAQAELRFCLSTNDYGSSKCTESHPPWWSSSLSSYWKNFLHYTSRQGLTIEQEHCWLPAVCYSPLSKDSFQSFAPSILSLQKVIKPSSFFWRTKAS